MRQRGDDYAFRPVTGPGCKGRLNPPPAALTGAQVCCAARIHLQSRRQAHVHADVGLPCPYPTGHGQPAGSLLRRFLATSPGPGNRGGAAAGRAGAY